MTSETEKPDDDAKPSDVEQTRANESTPPRDKAIQYLYIPAGCYHLPPQVLPLDFQYLQRLLPGSEVRRMSQGKYRRLLESQKKPKESA